MKTFILYDDSHPNADGTRVLLDGLRLQRFEKNPVMLYMHRRSSTAGNPALGSEVIGRWEHIRREGSRLLAEAVFDTKDALSQKIAHKVEQGFLRAVSIGIDVHKSSSEKTHQLSGQSGVTFVESTLLEASIVDIPSNENALHQPVRYHAYGLAKIPGGEKNEQAFESFAWQLADFLSIKKDKDPNNLLPDMRERIDKLLARESQLVAFVEQLLDEALREGYLQEEDKEKYRLAFADDFMAAYASLKKRNETRSKQKENKQVFLQHFMNHLHADVPPGAAATASPSETDDSVYQQLLAHEPERLRTLRQHDPTAFRQLLEAHLAWKSQKKKSIS